MPNNQLDILPFDIFHNLTEIKILKMEKNKLKKLHPDQFQGLEKLYDLYLSENELRELPTGIFKGLKSLLSIDLFDNKIRNVSLETFKDAKLLRFLYFHYNEMSELPVGFFKNQFDDIIRATLDTNLMCCHLEYKQDAECVYPYNDNFANCDSMINRKTLRKAIWIIGSLSLGGAVFVIIWRLIFKEKNVVQSIMLTNLAVADGLMGVYLYTIAIRDATWFGSYYLHDYKWRTGWMCQVTGATAVLSSEVSVMLLSLISADRVKNIVFPYQGDALTRTKTHLFCLTIWVLGFLIAFLPMFGIQYFNEPNAFQHYYGRTVVCLPLQLSADFPSGWEYSVSVFIGLNFVLFLVITVGYLMILYKSCMSSWRLAHQGTVREVEARSRSASNKREAALARRVFTIILTDALCWFPVIIYGIRSIVEKAFDEPGDLAVLIAVFVLPINSAINPILYTLSTEQVRGILKSILAKPWNYLRSFFPCGQDQEEQEDEGEQQQQGIEDHEQHSNDEEHGEQELLEMGVLGLPHPGQDECEAGVELQSVKSGGEGSDQDTEPVECVIEGVRKRGSIRAFTIPRKQAKKKQEVVDMPDELIVEGEGSVKCQLPPVQERYYTRSKAVSRNQALVKTV